MDTIWDELSPKANKRNPDFELKITEIDESIVKAEETKKKAEIYSSLREKYRYLKAVQDDVGMGGKMREEDEDSIED